MTTKNLFLLGISYDIVTEESSQEGDVSESGWEREKSPATLRECLDAVKALGGIDYHDGVSFYPCDASIDYFTGDSRREYVHVECLSDAAYKAWMKVLKVAGI